MKKYYNVFFVIGLLSTLICMASDTPQSFPSVFNLSIKEDGTSLSLHEAFNSAIFILQAMHAETNSDNLAAHLEKNLKTDFLGALHYDASNIADSYRLVCKDIVANAASPYDNQYLGTSDPTQRALLKIIAGKIVYVDFCHIPTQAVCTVIKQSIRKNEEAMFANLFWNSYMCDGSDYKELLMHIENLVHATDYTFALVIKRAKKLDIGVMVINKHAGHIAYICSNVDFIYDNASYMHHFLTDSTFLKDAITRYICAIHSPFMAQYEMEKLGLADYPLYVDSYKQPKKLQLCKRAIKKINDLLPIF
jgi:hypothetical protein